jgi:hypothetical protein
MLKFWMQFESRREAFFSTFIIKHRETTWRGWGRVKTRQTDKTFSAINVIYGLSNTQYSGCSQNDLFKFREFIIKISYYINILRPNHSQENLKLHVDVISFPEFQFAYYVVFT